jgi:hypothetical protein
LPAAGEAADAATVRATAATIAAEASAVLVPILSPSRAQPRSRATTGLTNAYVATRDVRAARRSQR